ncbi:MAG TPA: ACP S-malonyltransferase [Vicinamibacterales bacterium]|nr:ACP S-malonyltransferase [Vicinamibacterales bacterium]
MIAFVFPGQGSQVVGMGKALAEAFPVCRAVFDAADRALREPLSRVIFDGPAEALTLTENAQPAILTMSMAAAQLLDLRGIRPDVVAGHSLGEYSAHVAAGTLAFEDAVRLVRNRGRYMQEAVPAGTGAMAAILGLDEAAVVEACAQAAQGEVVSPANLNGAGQIVIAGTATAVRRAGEQAMALGAKRVIPLNVSAPFHCALMNPAGERLAPELRAAPSHDPRVPVVANVDALPRTTASGAIEALIAQVSSPVRWADSVTRLAAEGATTFIEVGPGTVLSGLVRKIARGAAVFNLQAPADLAAIEAALVRV